MKKLIFIVFVLISFVSKAQFNLLVDTLQYEDGGSTYYYATSGDTVFINNDTIIKINTYLTDVDTRNLSKVRFIVGDDTLYYTLAHDHPSYAPLAILDDYVPYIGAVDNVELGNYNLYANYLTLNPISNPGYVDGGLYYDTDLSALTFFNDEADISLQIGEENWVRVRNNSGATIYNGQPVYITGATGQVSTIALADNSVRSTSRVAGLATHDIENSSFGYITTQGVVRGVDTDGDSDFATGETWNDGDELYLSGTAGDITNIRPTTGYLVNIGNVAYAHGTNGKMLVNLVIDGSLDTLLITDTSGADSVMIYDNGTKAVLESDNYLELSNDSTVLLNEVGIQNNSKALVTSNEIYDYIQSYVNQTKFVQTEITEVTNTVTETTLIGTGVGSVTFGANTLDSGNVIRCKVYGVYTNAELSGDEDVTVRIKLNSTTFVAGTLTLENSTTDYDFTLDFDIVVQSDGSSGKFIIGGGAQVDQRASTFANYIGFTSTTAETINTTIAQTLDITAQWGTASTDYSISTITLTTELIKQ